MTFNRMDVPEITPFAQESWADQRGDTFIEDIRVLGVSGIMRYVGQRQIHDFHPTDDTTNAGSEGFGFCSGLLIRDQGTGRYTFSHLEPFADTWHNRMNTGGREPVRWQSLHDAILIYGSLSSKQYEVERLMAEQFWGPATVRQVNLETGDTHWGLVFYGASGELAIVRKKPDQSVFRYKLFEPVGDTPAK